MSDVRVDAPKSWMQKFLDTVEWLGNWLPDPAILFVGALGITWLASLVLSGISFSEIDPLTMRPAEGQTVAHPKPIQVINQLTQKSLCCIAGQ